MGSVNEFSEIVDDFFVGSLHGEHTGKDTGKTIGRGLLQIAADIF
jgi:hypothetical protein